MDPQMMDELKFFLGLSAITIVVIGLVIYLGLKLNKTVDRSAAAVDFPWHITLTGTALWACVVGFWVICAVARELRPESLLGDFLSTTDGVASVLAGSLFFAVTAGVQTHAYLLHGRSTPFVDLSTEEWLNAIDNTIVGLEIGEFQMW